MAWAQSSPSNESSAVYEYPSSHKNNLDCHDIEGFKNRHNNGIGIQFIKTHCFSSLVKLNTEVIADASVVEAKHPQVEVDQNKPTVFPQTDRVTEGNRDSRATGSDAALRERQIFQERLRAAQEEYSRLAGARTRHVMSVEPKENSTSETVRRYRVREGRVSEGVGREVIQFNPLLFIENVEEIDCESRKMRIIESIEHRVYGREKRSRKTDWVDLSANSENESIAEYVCAK